MFRKEAVDESNRRGPISSTDPVSASSDFEIRFFQSESLEKRMENFSTVYYVLKVDSLNPEKRQNDIRDLRRPFLFKLLISKIIACCSESFFNLIISPWSVGHRWRSEAFLATNQYQFYSLYKKTSYCLPFTRVPWCTLAISGNMAHANHGKRRSSISVSTRDVFGNI